MAKLVLKRHLINREWCKGCGICTEFCPKQVLELDDEAKVIAARPEDCIFCAICCTMCPDVAITISEIEADAAAQKQTEVEDE